MVYINHAECQKYSCMWFCFVTENSNAHVNTQLLKTTAFSRQKLLHYYYVQQGWQESSNASA